jgi:hypothetical protein
LLRACRRVTDSQGIWLWKIIRKLSVEVYGWKFSKISLSEANFLNMYSPIFPRLVPERDFDLVGFLCMKGHIRYCSWSYVLGVNIDTRDLHVEDGMDSFYSSATTLFWVQGYNI